MIFDVARMKMTANEYFIEIVKSIIDRLNEK
jgi:hypothetical protein